MGYSTGDLDPFVKYTNRRDNRIRERSKLYTQIGQLQNDINRLNRDLPPKESYYAKNKPLMLNEINRKKGEIEELKKQIEKYNKDIANLEFDIKTIKALRDKNYNNTLQNNITKYEKKKSNTDVKLNVILPLKQKENSETANFYKLLESQNEEVNIEIVKQKNDLTTSDRKYIINDSKIPYYVSLNNILLFLYIIIAGYVSYKILKGMITQNIYGKLIIILLISLYPMYMFNLEMVIYDRYKLIKAMIRAEAYRPVE